ncbi:hypothetical protein Dimus_016958 [Dionaea muscipula]
MDIQEAAGAQSQIVFSKYTKRVVLKSVIERVDKGVGLVGQRVVVGGWVKSSKELRKEPPRAAVAVAEAVGDGRRDFSCSETLESWIPIIRLILKVFGGGGQLGKEQVEIGVQPLPPPLMASAVVLHISDGSCVDTLKVVVESSIASPGKIMNAGTCILVEGVVHLPSVSGKHIIELKAEKFLHIGIVDPEKYVLSSKRVPLDNLRNWAHFRSRTTTVASITRISNALIQGTHGFFQNNGFLYAQMPIITAIDSEGSSVKKFHVTTLLDKTMKEVDDTKGVGIETIKASIKKKSAHVEELKRSNSNKEVLLAAIQDLKKTSELASQLESKEKAAATASSFKSNGRGLSDDYFSHQAYLTVSGRLHLESYACALGHVYSVGPRFTAESSQSSKHAAEMWIVEAEMAFSEIEDAVSCAIDFLKFLCKWVLESCSEDMKFVLKRMDNTVADRLQSVISADFGKISYTEAVDVLRQVTERKFESNINWGLPLTEEHQSYLAESIYKRPVIVYDYPKETKPPFVRLNDDGKTVAAFDVIVPKVKCAPHKGRTNAC